MTGFVRACRLAVAVVLSLSLVPAAHAETVAGTPALVVSASVAEPAVVSEPATAPTATLRAAPAVPVALSELVARFVPASALDEAFNCLATAVYFEARGESLEGQLAVAEVVLNRAASGVYPKEVCAVVTQKAQFSFVRRGQLPRPDEASEAWRRAVAVAHVARNRLADAVPDNVLWYHADYVAPSWGKRLNRVSRIGAHIFYS